MKQAPQNLIDLIEPVITGMGYECVGIEFDGPLKNRILRVYIDHERGVVLDDCSQVSHQISGILEVEDPIPEAYQLEISSPGMNRPLFRIEHFERFKGQPVQLRLKQKIQDRRRPAGLILDVREDQILVQDTDQTVLEIPFNVIDRAHLIPDIKVGGGKKANGK